MSVYDELMNEAPQSPGDDVAPKRALKLKPSQYTGQTSIGSELRAEHAGRKITGSTSKWREASRKRLLSQQGAQGPGQLPSMVYNIAGESPGKGAPPKQAPVRQAAGTTYEGPSLREKVEYIRSFL